MKRPSIGAKGFQSFHWIRGTSSRKVIEAYQKKKTLCVWEERRRKRRMNYEKGC
jgi:hypothetical protein